MVLYGIIEDGVLRTQEIVQRTERIQVVKDDKPTIQERIITVDEQIKELTKAGWKPVDMIDESKLECAPGYAIRIVAVEYDDHIGYTYEKIQNLAYYKKQIKALKEELDNTDYKVIKCYEAFLVGEAMPYNAQDLHTSRQSIRDKINSLEVALKRLTEKSE